MTLIEQIRHDLTDLKEVELRQVADYLAFLGDKEHRKIGSQLDESQIANLYADFEEEDRVLSETGMEEYA